MTDDKSPIIYKGFYIYWNPEKSDVYLTDTLASGLIRHFRSMHAAKCFITRYMVPAYAAGSYARI